ncbi:hypothetical protein ACFWFF_10640 [Streptomyces sp. NPDC060223]|uniref:hypothetical protein n=1 Tax=unclassified Streptomyces TaxID=2593676 RepID=UPI00363380FB
MAYAGRRDNQPDLGDYAWTDLSDNGNYPDNVCGISISAQGNDSSIKVVTTEGDIWETLGDTNGNNFSWTDEWDPVDAPTAVNRAIIKSKGDLSTIGSLNGLPANRKGS